MFGIRRKIATGYRLVRDRTVSRVRRWDWRFWSILSATLIALVITFVAPYFRPTLLEVAVFEGAFFASWVAGVALFALVGLIVAIVSVSRPDRESFESRALNFLQRQHGGHIAYMVGKLRTTVEPYVEHTTKKLIVEEWRQDVNKIRIRHETRATLRGFLDDVPIKFPAQLNYISYCEPPKGGQKPCVAYIRVNGEEVHGFKEFEKDFHHHFEGDARSNDVCTVEHVMSYWIEPLNEVNRHKTIRYTRRIEVHVENRDNKHTMIVDIQSGAPQEKIHLKPGETRKVIQLSESLPDQYVYDFRILPA